ncbi:tape measure protein [Anaerotignum lactatifermentans]|uniref:tape measure protein n=1 Tax=Anaerotignum lactatifermentans TaxID=160404 RepID=UPI003AB854E0
MGNIREVLAIEDKFSAGLGAYIKMMEQSGAVTKETTAAAKMAAQQARVYQSALRVQTAEQRLAAAQAKAQTASIRAAAAAEKEAERQARAAAKAQKEYNQSMESGTGSADRLTASLKKMAGGYIGLQGVKGLLQMSDTLVSTTARLDMVNDGLQSTAALNNMIFASANRARGSYAETAAMVSKLGLLAGDAFGSTQEIVAFAEQLNKQMAISGTTTAEAQGAMLQLTQAMASGVLRGEELNSVIDHLPMVTESIIKYLGISKGELKDLASEGAITAEIVKNAMFAAAEETNAKFEEMPMTWGQVWTIFGNYATKALTPVLLGLSWLANNLEIIGPLVLGAGAAFAIFQVAANWTKIATVVTGAYNAAVTFLKVGYGLLRNQTMAAAIAQHTYNSALLASPITWVLMGLALIVGALYAGVAAYNHFTGASVSATGIIAGVMSALGAHVYNTVAFMYNGFAVFANLLGNIFNNPIAAIKIAFYDMAQTVLGYFLNIADGIEGLINKIPGKTVDLTSGLESSINSLGAKSAALKESSGWKEYFSPMEYKDYGSAFSSGYDKGSNFFSNIFGGGGSGAGDYGVPNYDAATPVLEGIGKDVGSIKKSVDMSKEDIKLMVDMATQRYVNKINLTAQTPVITVNGANTGNTEADRKSLADALAIILQEQRAAGSAKSTARV